MAVAVPELERIRRTYDAAADCYDQPPLAFRDALGRAMIARIPLRAGQHVLDVGCGSGAATIPAARAVGSHGRVLGVELTARLLDLARAKVARAKLAQVELMEGILDELNEPAASFQLVVSLLAARFALPDLNATVRRLWRWAGQGGYLALTLWGVRPLEPLAEIFWRHVRAVRPDLGPGASAWGAINTPPAVATLFREAGINSVATDAAALEQRLRSAEDGWTILMGTWHRGIIEALTLPECAKVRAAVLAELEARAIVRVEVNVVHALARKP